jgi:hypothetical protein
MKMQLLKLGIYLLRALPVAPGLPPGVTPCHINEHFLST